MTPSKVAALLIMSPIISSLFISLIITTSSMYVMCFALVCWLACVSVSGSFRIHFTSVCGRGFRRAIEPIKFSPGSTCVEGGSFGSVNP